ncbi:MAG: SPOR domain-containing protein [Methylobacter sp.]|nr:SPOR domain-containing protein [Methylobacter sp.]
MDHELKQRLIGAVVVTALCAIFIPMLFDDPVENSGQLVSELNIPAADAPGADNRPLPTSADQVLKSQDPEPLSTETGDSIESTGAAEEVTEEPEKHGRSEESLYAESEGYTQEDNNQEEPVDEAEDSQPKLHPKPAKPLAAEAGNGVHKSMPLKTPIQYDHVDVAAGDLSKIKKAMEAAKPVAAKKPENEASLAVRKPSDTMEPPHPTLPKQPNSAKSLAAAVAEAKNPEVAPKPAAKLVRWYIQLGSFSKKENATSLWESLHEQGLPASLDTVQTDKGTSYRLRLGPELDGKKAAAMKARLDKQNIKAILMSE